MKSTVYVNKKGEKKMKIYVKSKKIAWVSKIISENVPDFQSAHGEKKKTK